MTDGGSSGPDLSSLWHSRLIGATKSDRWDSWTKTDWWDKHPCLIGSLSINHHLTICAAASVRSFCGPFQALHIRYFWWDRHSCLIDGTGAKTDWWDSHPCLIGCFTFHHLATETIILPSAIIPMPEP